MVYISTGCTKKCWYQTGLLFTIDEHKACLSFGYYSQYSGQVFELQQFNKLYINIFLYTLSRFLKKRCLEIFVIALNRNSFAFNITLISFKFKVKKEILIYLIKRCFCFVCETKLLFNIAFQTQTLKKN